MQHFIRFQLARPRRAVPQRQLGFLLLLLLLYATGLQKKVAFAVELVVLQTWFVCRRCVKYGDHSVSVCLSACISQQPHIHTSSNFLYMFHVAMVHSSYDNAMYWCTSTFVDDVTCSHNSQVQETWMGHMLTATHNTGAVGCLWLPCWANWNTTMLLLHNHLETLQKCCCTHE